ncbi:Hint domain-containing protein [Alloyangia pacifica]|uniref:Hint domain-containing protein n=1 Tax=Alloyangia pacifica TaxID=311180 RepID=A0A1I6U405_9RHOB|nr:Hint domain-containing protein [Alloyangia pacifica]SDH37580.1 Hint domain-containing protein [Alloyangia pacifica]SFS96249.1 Hint domain-containing protein [Alloyangia pacifica]
MTTALHGTFVVSWSQTRIDGLKAAPPSSLQVGARWAWNGDVVRVDGLVGPSERDRGDGEAARRRRAAAQVRLLVGEALAGSAAPGMVPGTLDAGFVVSDGLKSYTVTRIDIADSPRPLLMFLDDVPPPGRDLWVVHTAGGMSLRAEQGRPDGGGVICFAVGTRILTSRGQVAVETLREGDMVQTKDDGLQPVHWVGSRRMSGARLHVLPELRPVRIRAGAFGIERPDDEFLVSPEHRMLIRGAVARSLFNTDEVLVAAKHLVNGSTICRDLRVREVTYVHLLLPRHEIVFANGVETESFHPANTALSSLSDVDRARLLALLPGVELRPTDYGAHARRNLTARESALLIRQAS